MSDESLTGGDVPRPRRGRRAQKVRLVIGAAIIVCALAVLITRANRSGVVYYMTVSELKQQGPQADPRGLRVAGKVVPGTIERKNLDLRFRMTDGEAAMPVEYHGVIPDTFSEDGEVVVEGKVSASGVFEASFLMAKCPSKYEAAPSDPKGRHPEGVPRTS